MNFRISRIVIQDEAWFEYWAAFSAKVFIFLVWCWLENGATKFRLLGLIAPARLRISFSWIGYKRGGDGEYASCRMDEHLASTLLLMDLG